MLKLMKYEFRKQAFSKGVILALLAIAEIVFGYSVITDNENVLATSIGLLVTIAFASLFFVSYEAIITFSKDLKEKCSYMLFLVPKSTYTIIGAKVLSAAIQVLVVGLVFFGVAAGDFAILVAKYDSIAEIKEFVSKIMNEILSYNVTGTDVFIVLVNSLFSWISVITVAFFSISLSATFLANKKFKGIVSFIIFIAINYLFSYITKLTVGEITEFSQTKILLDTIYMIFFTIISYVGTGYVLDKKVSV